MAPGGNIIVTTREGLDVKARQRLNTETEFETFINLFMEKLESSAAGGGHVVVSDLDLSQNKLTIDQWCQIITALCAANARVLRFRLFGSASLNDDIMVQIADYFAGLSSQQAPQEIHLSDCAITTSGFKYFVEKIESVDYYPLKAERAGGRPTPLYVRLENNYIEEQAIKEKVDAGVIKPFTKKEGRWGGDNGAKINLLVQTHGRLQQKTGTPPSPEDAPPPKQIITDQGSSRGSWNVDGGAHARNGGSSWGNNRRNDGQQWSATTRGGATTRWSGGAASQGPKPAVTPWESRSTSMARAQRGYGANQGSVDRSRTPTARGGMADRGVKGFGKGRAQRLPHPWEEHWSDDYNIPYFWNSETGSSVWERPVA